MNNASNFEKNGQCHSVVPSSLFLFVWLFAFFFFFYSTLKLCSHMQAAFDN